MTTEIKISGQDFILAYDMSIVTKDEVRVAFGLPAKMEEGDK
jgi:hypothetical protein